VVAAETQQQAWDAVRAIKVEYEKLPFLTCMEDALKVALPRSSRMEIASPSPTG
jgi:CO/xanthine dehydrogenase Mo-binding subunit